jgi:hypothetical protein
LWDNLGIEQQLRETLVSFEHNFVGTAEELEEDGIGPSELHRQLPRARRTRVGLGAPEPAESIFPSDVRINNNAVEAEKERYENKQKEKGMKEVHSVRQAREVETIGTATGIYFSEKVPTARNLDKIRLRSGLFVAARESSHDWNMSYDQMDIVRSGHIAVERGKLEDEKGKPKDSSGNSEAHLEDAKGMGEKAPMIDITEQDPEDGVEGLLNEFCRDKQPHKEYTLVPTTAFAEMSYGRREREHAHMNLRPSSPVLSPPHSPIFLDATAGKPVIPADVPGRHEAFHRYRRKFQDPYGVNYRQWPAFEGLHQGGGYKVTYEPLDIAALPKHLQEQHDSGTTTLDESGRFTLPVPDGTSMRLLREALNKPYEPLQRFVVTGEEESDDKGDLFREAYLEGSLVQSSEDVVAPS